jgi:hypothetical protein
MNSGDETWQMWLFVERSSTIECYCHPPQKKKLEMFASKRASKCLLLLLLCQEQNSTTSCAVGFTGNPFKSELILRSKSYLEHIFEEQTSNFFWYKNLYLGTKPGNEFSY